MGKSDVRCPKCGKATNESASEYPTWIPISEKLPENDTQVLCVNENGNIFIGRFKIGGWQVQADENYFVHCYSKITHWTPLPKLPEDNHDKLRN